MSRYVVCLGSVNLDLLYEVNDIRGFLAAWGTGLNLGAEEVLTPEAEERLRDILPRFARLTGRTAGGQTANAAYALSRLEVPVVLLGRVGADDDGAFLKEGLPGVNLEHLVIRGETGRTYILVDTEGRQTKLTAPNTNDLLEEADIPLTVVEGSAFIHVTHCAGEGPLKAVQHILERLAGSLRVCFDPGGLLARRGREALAGILDQTETLLVTEREWELFGGEPRRLSEWAPPVVLVKRGPRGSRMLTPVRYLDFPPYLREGEADTVGAWDVFAAGYLAGLFRGLNLPQAVRLASALATYALGGPGRERYPDRRIMETVIDSLR